MDITTQRCGNCQFSLQDGPNLICRRYPPTVFMIQMQNRVLMSQGQSGPMPGLQSAFPPVAFEGLCGEHEVRTEGTA